MKTSISRNHLGFSLLEMLIVVSIIGIMANMIILSWGNASREASEMKDRRNAQEIASLAAIAKAAGAPFVVPNDKKATIDNLAAGAKPSSGIFKNREFKLPPIGPKGIEGAMHYLALHNTELVYTR